MAIVTVCSDLGAQEKEIQQFPLFPHLFAMKQWDWMQWSSFFEYWVLSQLLLHIWMASLTKWTWVWVNSRSSWWTGRPGVLQFTGSQRGGHDWATELNDRKQSGTKEPLEGERGEWKSWFKTQHSKKTNIMASGPITSWQIDGEKVETATDLIFLGSKITVDSDCSKEIKRHLLLRRKAVTNLDSILKNRDITLPTKVCLVKAMVFPVVIYWMWEVYCKWGWVLKNWCFQTVVLEKTFESPFDFKQIKIVNTKGKQPWILIGRTEHGAEVPILWPRIKEPTHWKRPWSWEILKTKEGGHRGWDG